MAARNWSSARKQFHEKQCTYLKNSRFVRHLPAFPPPANPHDCRCQRFARCHLIHCRFTCGRVRAEWHAGSHSGRSGPRAPHCSRSRRLGAAAPDTAASLSQRAAGARGNAAAGTATDDGVAATAACGGTVAATATSSQTTATGKDRQAGAPAGRKEAAIAGVINAASSAAGKRLASPGRHSGVQARCGNPVRRRRSVRAGCASRQQGPSGRTNIRSRRRPQDGTPAGQRA
jgi:hypothetical protein